MYTVAISYLEWIRWVATGWFRCADRVVWMCGVEDQQGMDALMDRTPDLQVSDDQGYVIARLNLNALISGRVGERERSIGHLWLSVASVSSFYPLSSRGARLLEADAERAAVRLGEPIFENLWVDWRDRQLEDEAHWRGFSLCTALGLGRPVLENVTQQVSDILAGRRAAPNAAKVREDVIEGTRALGWASAMSVAVMESDVRTAFRDTSEFVQIQSLIKEYRNDFDLGRPLLDDEPTISFVRSTDGVLRELGAQVPPLELMATVLHYRSLATSGRQLSLSALVDDLVSIAIQDPNEASLAAYFIGRGMENVAVTTILYQCDPTQYSALCPSVTGVQLNVMALAAERLGAAKTLDDARGRKSDESCMLDGPSGNSELVVVDETIIAQPAEAEHHVDDEVNSRPDDSSTITYGTAKPQSEGAVTSTLGSSEAVVASLEGVNISSPEGGRNDMHQPGNTPSENFTGQPEQLFNGDETLKEAEMPHSPRVDGGESTSVTTPPDGLPTSGNSSVSPPTKIRRARKKI